MVTSDTIQAEVMIGTIPYLVLYTVKRTGTLASFDDRLQGTWKHKCHDFSKYQPPNLILTQSYINLMNINSLGLFLLAGKMTVKPVI